MNIFIKSMNAFRLVVILTLFHIVGQMNKTFSIVLALWNGYLNFLIAVS